MDSNEKTSNAESDDLHGMEAYLRSVLLPVSPSQTFVSNLKETLLNTPIPAGRLVTILGYTAMVSAILISTVIIIATGVRAALAFIGARGLIQQLREQKAQTRLA